VAALYIVARSVEKTGALQPIVQGMLGNGNGMRTSLGRLLVPTAGASAFLNNTPIVAMLIPQVSEWAERRGRPASWYLLPLSFAAILGGTITVIGTSTNLVVSGLLEASGQPPLGMFEMTRVGLPIAIVGLVALVLLAPRLLPDRRPARTQFSEEMREFVVRMQVDGNGAMAGRSVEDAGLRHLKGVFLAEIERGERVIAPVAPAERLEHGDHLTFVGRADDVLDLQAMRGLSPAVAKQASGLDGPEHTFFETVVSAASPLVGKTLKEVDFRNRYQAAVYAIHRAGHRVKAKLGDVQMRPGDTLLLLADDGFRDRWRDRSDFLLVSKLGGSPPVGSRKAWIVGAITLGIVLFAGMGMIPILQAALLGAIALVLLRVLSPRRPAPPWTSTSSC
jgi:di/tricarboxylate transporter